MQDVIDPDHISTTFDDIAGIGERRKEMLNKAYPSLEQLEEASLEELNQIVPLTVAKAIKDKLNKEQANSSEK